MSTMDQAMNYLADDIAIRGKIQSVTIPFTPDSNGLLFIFLRATATGRFYDTYSNAWPGIADGYSTANSYLQSVSFVQKGKTVTRTGTGNVQSRDYRFVPISVE